MPLRVHVVVGARPNLPKAAALFLAAGGRDLVLDLIHTGQHTSPVMSDAFAADLGLPVPSHILSWAPNGDRVRAMSRAYGDLLQAAPPDAVAVLGDVDSTLAATLGATGAGVPVVHVEAGLRSRELERKEETNRRVVDRLADRLYTHSHTATHQLQREGRAAEDIVEVGNVMVDTLIAMADRTCPPEFDPIPTTFGLVTLHRPELVEHPELLNPVLDALAILADDVPLLFPTHPRTADRIAELRWTPSPGLTLLPPLLYSRFAWLLRRARVVITDSGGVQEEAAFLGRPCLTVRPDTERPVTTTDGTNEVVGRDPKRLLAAARASLARPIPGAPALRGWDGQAASRLLDDLEGWITRR